MVGCFLVYLFLTEVGRLLKGVKKFVCVLVLKIALFLRKNVCFRVKKGISELLGIPKIYYLEDREGLSDHLKQMIKRLENKKKIRIIRAAV